MLEAVTLVAVLGALFGLILAFADKKFAVDVDPSIDIVAGLLPGANCGACGYPGCHALAEAIVAGETGIAPCVGCTTEVKQKIAEALGLTKEMPLSKDLRKVARLACNGCEVNAPKTYNYTGVEDCHLAAKTQGGPGKCNFGCLGFGSCVKSCPFQAITMSSNGLPVFDYTKCTGCGVCVAQCPQKVLYLSDANAKIHVKCNNRAKGKAAMTNCSVSCISCGLCAKNCPTKAITMVEDSNGSLPVIDREKCIECGLCVKSCPRHCIHYLEPIKSEIETMTEQQPLNPGCANCASRENCGMHL